MKAHSGPQSNRATQSGSRSLSGARRAATINSAEAPACAHTQWQGKYIIGQRSSGWLGCHSSRWRLSVSIYRILSAPVKIQLHLATAYFASCAIIFDYDLNRTLDCLIKLAPPEMAMELSTRLSNKAKIRRNIKQEWPFVGFFHVKNGHCSANSCL